MKEYQVREVIDEVLRTVPFNASIDRDYCIAVRDALRAPLPDAKLDVFHRNTEFVVIARLPEFDCVVTLSLV